MKKNLSTTDRMFRLGLAFVSVVLIVTGAVSGTLAIVAGVVAVLMVATSGISWCPVYAALGWTTKKEQK
jgi:hypothetical protein